ncbi:BTB/POZ domain-containing protein POB1 [Acorus calamus]|uniref:BTB/POZ domain-containing protein POB1 n=1 Tax=Acorus calamus TaxID=4465 RepID=A0AAV9C873_ACOCL|nr:BTB/POZ domain-containing protein POB1 [Acorus calamus]
MDIQEDDHVSFEFAFNNPQFSDRIFPIEISNETLVDKQIKSSTTIGPKKRKINKNQIPAEDEHEMYKKVKYMHVNSALLAVKSAFFYKLFSNGMRDSNHKYRTTLKIQASEEAPLKELLRFMYKGRFSSTDLSDHHSLLEILIIADKFEVIQCMKYCVQLLLKLPMTQESALLYLELPSSVSTNMEVQKLISASREHLVAHFSDTENSHDELVNLSIAGLEVILSSDDILPTSEDEDENLQGKYELASKDSANKQLLQRSYKLWPINVVESETPRRHSIVYFNLSRTECAGLFPSGEIETQLFPVGGHMFSLIAGCEGNIGSLSRSFEIWLYLDSSEKISVPFHFAVRKNPSELFNEVKNGNCTFESLEGSEYNLFSTPWSSFVAENSSYFINGMLHLRAEIILKN